MISGLTLSATCTACVASLSIEVFRDPDPSDDPESWLLLLSIVSHIFSKFLKCVEIYALPQLKVADLVEWKSGYNVAGTAYISSCRRIRSKPKLNLKTCRSSSGIRKKSGATSTLCQASQRNRGRNGVCQGKIRHRKLL